MNRPTIALTNASFLTAFVFTINNPTEDDINKIHNHEDIQYVIYGREVGENLTQHLQGYCELKKKMRFPAVKVIFPRAYIARRRGTQKQAIAYCCKDDQNPYIRGEPKRQGKRNDVKAVRELIQGGSTMIDVLNQATSLQSIKIAQVFFQYEQLNPKAWIAKKIYWYYGETGTGKSKRAHREAGEEQDKNNGGFWKSPVKNEIQYFNGYYGQKNVIFDEYRPKRIPMDHLLQLTDGYECYVDVKQTGAVWRAENIWITANKKPEDMFQYEGKQHEKIDQLLRRITKVVWFRKLGQEDVSQDDYEDNWTEQEKQDGYKVVNDDN